MHLAVQKENIEIIKLLLNHRDIDVNAKDDIHHICISNLKLNVVNDFFFFAFEKNLLNMLQMIKSKNYFICILVQLHFLNQNAIFDQIKYIIKLFFLILINLEAKTNIFFFTIL